MTEVRVYHCTYLPTYLPTHAASYLATNLSAVNCHVLSAPSESKEFAYFLPGRKFSSLAQANAAGSDRVLADYRFEKPQVDFIHLSVYIYLCYSMYYAAFFCLPPEYKTYI